MTVEVPEGYRGLVVGCPIPYEFFKSKGTGQSGDQNHAGSYHKAMREAGVELGNLVPYTSILPRIAREISLDEGMDRIQHGAQVGVIQAAAHIDTEKGQKRATSAILYGWLHPKGERMREHAGGLVCEYNGEGTIDDAVKNVNSCLDELFTGKNRKGFAFSDRYDLHKQEPIVATIAPEQRFGTAFCVIAFVSYVVPVLGQNILPKDEDAFALAQSTFGQRGI